jgi:hypothetical protein
MKIFRPKIIDILVSPLASHSSEEGGRKCLRITCEKRKIRVAAVPSSSLDETHECPN